MNITSTLEELHAKSKNNRWMRFFTVCTRLSLALGFLMAGYVKIIGERFTDLSNNQPMGHYLEALFHTGYYYTSIGIFQIAAALLLLIPRTATIGAILYFPIIFNICILSFAVRFEGSLITAPLMVIANLYLLCWDYDKLKFLIFPKSKFAVIDEIDSKPLSNKFPFKFFSTVLVTMVLTVAIVVNIYDIMPRNTLSDCEAQTRGTVNLQVKKEFCECIHLQGKPLDKCLESYSKAVKK